MNKNFQLKNSWVLITGASSGLGFEFASQCAMQGANLLLVARNLETLRDMKATLEGKYEVNVEVASIDLSDEQAVHKLIEYVKQFNIDIDVVINNAGFGLTDTFYHQQQDDIHRMNMVNMTSVADITNVFIQGMIKRGVGGILNVASIAAFQPLPYSANYAATKSYVLSLSTALHQEVHKKGVHVSCLCPGPVKTNFFNAAGIPNPIGKFATAESVAKQGLQGLLKNKVIMIPKEHRFGIHTLGPFVPTKAKLRIIERMFKP